MIKVGCCGFRGRREDYFKNFDVVEIQKTFYKLPSVETAKKWRKEAPDNFEFAMKAWQIITHTPKSPTYRKAGIKIEGDEKNYGFFKPTKEVFEAWDKCEEFALSLGAKIVVFQCPPSFHESQENLKNIREFFSSISGEFSYAWEVRGRWKKETIIDICREFNLIHCVDPFKNESFYGFPKYYRLHGIGGYNYEYSMDELRKLYGMCKGKDAYCLFNNIFMLKNALQFKNLLKSV